MQIYVMNSDGTGQTRLTADSSNNESPRWSPDGTKILFQTDRDNPGSGLRDIYVMNSNGSGQTRLTTDANDDCFASWSSDGTKIVFQSFRNGVSYQIYTMNADGSGQTNISNNGVNDVQPSWSPDGTKIAFASDRDQPGFPSIYMMNSNGTNQTRLTFSGAGLRDEQPVWSPNGSKIAFTSTRNSTTDSWTETDDYEIPEDDGQTFPKSRLNTNKEVYVMNPNGSSQTRLTNDLSNDDSPTWSPDGTKIVFRSERDRDLFDPTPQLWTMNADGSGQTNLSNSGDSDFSPSWTSGSANQPPVAVPGGPYSGVVSQNSPFSGSGSYDPDGSIVSYAWTFGDGGTGSGVAPYHAYATTGTFNVTLTVTDNLGAQASASTTATITTPNQPPVANAGGPYSGTSGQAVQFNGGASSDPDGSVASYSWNFGDGANGSGVAPTHSYSSPGTYTITLTVTDNQGATASANTTAAISNANQSPVANAGGPYSGVVSQNAPFSGNGSYDPDGSIVSYSWTFGDGGTGSGVAPYHAYATTGTFTVTLTVTDNLGAQATASTTINVSASSSDQYATSFLQWALGRPPNGEESAYWTDIFRAAYPKGLSSMKLATRELGMTVFESAEYAARNRNDHWYVYDLYKTFLMREPDVEGWAYWEAAIAIYGRDQIRRGFDESTEFANIVATLTASGSPSANVSSLATARVDPFNQSGNQLQARDAEWSATLLSLPGRAGLDLGLGISYSSLVFTRSGPYSYFDADNGSPSPGFHIGFPTIQDKYFDAQVGANVYLLKTSAGRKIELRQVGTSNVYESADSSYIQLIYSGNLLLRTTDGTQMTFGWTGLNEYRCIEIKDRNGNYIAVSYNWRGDIQNVTDTLGRVITFNYDANANLNSITQTWNGQAHVWASFGWENLTMSPTVTGVVGTYSGEVMPVLKMVALHDGTYTKFLYNGNGQVRQSTQYASDSNPATDNHPRNYTIFDYDSATTDCPRLISTRTWAEYWTGLNGVPTEVTTYFGVEGDTRVLTAPDGTVYKETYAGSSDAAWMRGLVKSSEVRSGGMQQKLSTVAWTQDNTNVVYKTNPRVIETNVYDSVGNRRRTTIDYSVAAYTQYGLPYFVREFAADATTPLRTKYSDYNLAPEYLERRIIGLVDTIHVVDHVTGSYVSKVSLSYDWDNQSNTYLIDQGGATQHDNVNYGASFRAGRGNLCAVRRWNVNAITDWNQGQWVSFRGYNTNGSVIFTADALGHETRFSYSDSFSADGVNLDAPRHFSTFAYPTTITDADGFSSTLRYRYDFGAKTRVEGPPPQNQPNGIIQTFAYDSAARLQRTTIANTGAYTHNVYGPNYVQSYSSVNNVAANYSESDLYSITVFDGVGRGFTATTNHPGSDGGYKLVNVIFDRMGRPVLQSNPTEVNPSWLPAGDDQVGVRYSVLDFDWQGRTKRKTHPDGAYSEANYAGCGCAGGEVVTLTDEVGRRQKAYSDVLGRNWKTEILNWDGSVYTTTTKTFNARDQVKLMRQWVGAENGAGTYQETTINFDGYGRLQSKHVPQQDAGTATTWEYNNDDTLHKVTDARGASATYVYNNNRHLVNGINYFASSGLATTPNVTFEYDQVGNRTLMTDGLGSQSYVYNSLSQMTSETRNFADPVSPYLSASFTFSYDYNLAGELKKITDPTNSTINYGFDSIGRLANITGSDNLYGGVSNYASGFSYRASGSIKGLTYGNNFTMLATYDSRLRPSRFQVTAASGQDAIKNDYSYYADGSPKYLHNLLDERFDRAYGYDHRSTIQQAFSGSEARDFVNNTTTPGATGPYWQIYQHDAFGNMTQRDNRFWTQSDVYTATYSNNRRTETGYQYDADGNLLHDPDANYGYDAAGSNVSLSSPNGTVYTTVFDGDGQMVKRVHTFSGNTIFVKYSLHSSVLGGRIVTEVNAQGQKLSTYVFAGSQLLARQQGNDVAWEHRDPLSGSQVDSFASSGAFSPISQLDPTGIDVGFEDPFTPLYEPSPSSDGGTPLLLWGDGIPSGRCTLDGIAIDCGWAFQMMSSGSAVQCPNNDCGPRVMNSFDRNGHFLGQVLSQAFQAFADGFSGFLPPGARYQGGGMWSIPSAANRQSTPPSLKPAANRVNHVGNRDPYGIGYDEGAITGTLGVTSVYMTGFSGPQNPQNNWMNNNPDSIGNDSKYCSIKVSFTGSNQLFTNGAGARNVSQAGYGVGFTVSGSVQGQIGKVDVTPGRTDTVNASGAWTIQQYVANSTQASYDLSGSKVFYRSVATKPDGPFPEFRQINGSNFTYFDFPGPITPLAMDGGRNANLTSYQGEWDFAVKVINGQQHCEVKFHLSMRFQGGNWTANWGSR